MNSRESTILIIDDIQENRTLLASIIKDNTYYNINIASSGKNVLQIIEKKLPDLILLDIMMPEINGFEVAAVLKERELTKNIPIIFITALIDEENINKAFEIGGVDYITKPFRKSEVLKRIETHIKLKKLIDNLDGQVKQKTIELQELSSGLIIALEKANYYNDDDTGNHIKRVSHYSKILALGSNLDPKVSNVIFNYASIHDIGKVGVPEAILKKPGKLTTEEFEIIKMHCHIGYKLVETLIIPDIAKNIIYCHHEKWDGSGYPQNLKGGDIPIEGRIVALADVYDALRNERVYKPAFTLEETEKIIFEESGKHFDPELVEVYKQYRDAFDKIYQEY